MRAEPGRLPTGIGNRTGMWRQHAREFYADVYRRYATYCRHFDDARLRIAVVHNADITGPMCSWRSGVLDEGLSLHYYSIIHG